MSDSEISELYRLIRELTDRVGELSTSLARIEVKLAERKECPSPGLCMQLLPRVEKIETLVAELRGARKALTVLYVLFGGAIAAMATAVAKHLGWI